MLLQILHKQLNYRHLMHFQANLKVSLKLPCIQICINAPSLRKTLPDFYDIMYKIEFVKPELASVSQLLTHTHARVYARSRAHTLSRRQPASQHEGKRSCNGDFKDVYQHQPTSARRGRRPRGCGTTTRMASRRAGCRQFPFEQGAVTRLRRRERTSSVLYKSAKLQLLDR